MKETKIQQAAVDAAVASADDALANKRGMAWMRKSCLVERAYFWGLYFGLKAIANKDDLQGLLNRAALGALFDREADDTFPSPTIAHDYEALMSALISALGRLEQIYAVKQRLASTTVEGEYAALMSDLERFTESSTESSDDIKQRLDKLRTNINEQDSRWQASVRDVNDGLNYISKMVNDFQDDFRRDPGRIEPARLEDSMRRCDQVCSAVHTLEDGMRQIALLETSHEIRARFE
jgi:hypothetical protein